MHIYIYIYHYIQFGVYRGKPPDWAV